MYDDDAVEIEESQETRASVVQRPDAIHRPIVVKKTKNMSNALRVKKEANEKLKFLGKVQQRKAVVAEQALVLAKLRERREVFSGKGVSAQARAKYLRLTERKMLADLEKDLQEEVSTCQTQAYYCGDNSSSLYVLIANGEEFSSPDDEDLIPTEIRPCNSFENLNSKPRRVQMKDIQNDTTAHSGD